MIPQLKLRVQHLYTSLVKKIGKAGVFFAFYSIIMNARRLRTPLLDRVGIILVHDAGITDIMGGV